MASLPASFDPRVIAVAQAKRRARGLGAARKPQSAAGPNETVLGHGLIESPLSVVRGSLPAVTQIVAENLETLQGRVHPYAADRLSVDIDPSTGKSLERESIWISRFDLIRGESVSRTAALRAKPTSRIVDLVVGPGFIIARDWNSANWALADHDPTVKHLYHDPRLQKWLDPSDGTGLPRRDDSDALWDETRTGPEDRPPYYFQEDGPNGEDFIVMPDFETMENEDLDLEERENPFPFIWVQQGGDWIELDDMDRSARAEFLGDPGVRQILQEHGYKTPDFAGLGAYKPPPPEERWTAAELKRLRAAGYMELTPDLRPGFRCGSCAFGKPVKGPVCANGQCTNESVRALVAATHGCCDHFQPAKGKPVFEGVKPKRVIAEDGSEMTSYAFTAAAEKTLRSMGAKLTKPLGCGAEGCVYPGSNAGEVVKVSRNTREARLARWLIHNGHFLGVVGVRRVEPLGVDAVTNRSHDTGRTYHAIVMDNAENVSAYLRRKHQGAMYQPLQDALTELDLSGGIWREDHPAARKYNVDILRQLQAKSWDAAELYSSAKNSLDTIWDLKGYAEDFGSLENWGVVDSGDGVTMVLRDLGSVFIEAAESASLGVLPALIPLIVPTTHTAVVHTAAERGAAKAYKETFGKVLDPKLGYTFDVRTYDIDGETWTIVRVHPPTPDYPGQEYVGMARLLHSEDGSLWPAAVEVNERHRRQGIASAMYREAEKATGKRVRPSENQTPSGEALWEGNLDVHQFGGAKFKVEKGKAIVASTSLGAYSGHPHFAAALGRRFGLPVAWRGISGGGEDACHVFVVDGEGRSAAELHDDAAALLEADSTIGMVVESKVNSGARPFWVVCVSAGGLDILTQALGSTSAAG